MSINGKKILVTGADGFIGSHLTEMLLKEGAIVRALSYYNSFNFWGWIEEFKNSKNLEVLSGDVRDSYFCQKLTENMDMVFNLAALIAIPYSYKAPGSYIDTNITGALNICQGALSNGCKKVIQVSTSEVYGTAQYVPIDEKHPLQPQSPYSASKIGADAIALSHYYSFNLPVIIARPFNTYGPRQSARAVIPTIISQVLAGKLEIDLGSVTPTRDFNYVKDTCRGLILLAEAENTIGKTINIGSNSEISIGDLFNMIVELLNARATYICKEERIRPDKSEVGRLMCDNAVARELVGYKPEFDLRRGLEETIKWMKQKENIKKYKTDIYNV